MRGRMSESQLKEIIKEELENVLNEVKLDGYDYGLRGDDRHEFNRAMREDPEAAREVSRMSIEQGLTINNKGPCQERGIATKNNAKKTLTISF